MGAFTWQHFSAPGFLRRGTHRRTGSGTNHAAVNLLPGHGAFTSTKEPGTRTPATATTAECSSSQPRIAELVDARTGERTWIRLASSSTGHGSSGSATATPGENGAPPERAD